MTYQSRLILYVGMLIVLLVGMMTLSFKAARDVIVAGTDEHLRHAALRKEAGIGAQIQELEQYGEIIASDLRLQEYLYIILELGTSSDGLAAYYDRHFSSLPTTCRVIMSTGGEVLLGKEHPRLIQQMRSRLEGAGKEHFFFDSPDGVVMASMQPVLYQGESLAVTAVAKTMNQAWLNEQEHFASDYLLFFERNGLIALSSNKMYQQMKMEMRDGAHLYLQDEYFKLQRLSYSPSSAELPNLWLGVSESRVIAMLGDYQRWVFTFAVLGSLVVLLVGWLLLRNFNKPMERLMRTTSEMINGRLPVMVRSEANTEMDQLVNRFADVLDSLRREQSKVRRAHRKLQETAITDSLTGLYNRRYLQEVTPGLFAQIVRDSRYLTAVLLDLDYFKQINDKYGHLGGDAVLVHFARLLRHNSRANDFLFRIGGEEFLILNVAESPDDSVALASKMRELVNRSPAKYQGDIIPMTVSAGISCCYGKTGKISLSNLMRAADKALYEAKSEGRNRVVVHSSCKDAARVVKPRTGLKLVDSRPRQKPKS